MKKTAPKIIVQNPISGLEDMFKSCRMPPEADWPFEFFVAVCGRVDSPGPRDERWEHTLDLGRSKIEKVLNKEPIGPGPHHFVFPDRWMVPGESVMFGSALIENPDAKKFKTVYIVTHAPYIVSDCMREQCLIVTKSP